MIIPGFYPRGASYAGISRRRVPACVSVCLSVTRRYRIKTAKRIGSRKQRHVMVQGLMFSEANSRWWTTPPLSLKFVAQSDPRPFEHHDFDQYLLIAPQS